MKKNLISTHSPEQVNGYPKEDIDKLGNYFFTRQWEATEDEIGNDNG